MYSSCRHPIAIATGVHLLATVMLTLAAAAAAVLDSGRNRNSLRRRTAVLAVLAGFALTIIVGIGWASEPTGSGPIALGGNGWTRTLPNGISVELVGITSDPGGGDGEGWWGPDGKSILDPSEQGPTFLRQIGGFGDQYQRRTIYFRILSQPGTDDIGAMGAIARPSVWESGNFYRGESRLTSGLQLSPATPAWGKVAVAFNTPVDDFDYRFGVSSGPWSTLAVVRNSLHPIVGDVRPDVLQGHNMTNAGYQAYVILDDHPRIEDYDHDRRITSLSLLPPGETMEREVDRRFIATDAQGRSVPIDHWYTQANGDAMAKISPAALQTVSQFELQTRNYTWVRFDNVHNEPTAAKGVISPADDIPIPSSLPQFSRALPDGAHLDVTAVMRGRSEGERWWRPDGTPLKGRIKAWTTLMPSPDWPHGVRPREVFLRYTRPHSDDFAYSVRISMDADPKHPYIDGRQEYGFPKDQNLLAFDQPINVYFSAGPTARSMFISVGITAGRWKRIASLPMTLTPKTVGHNAHEQFGLYDAALRENGKASLRSFDPAGNLREQFFLSGDHMAPVGEAERIVAVMDDGTRMTVMCDYMAVNPLSQTVERWSPFYLDPSKPHDYRQPDLIKVRRFDLEVQPYTWVTYPAIPLDPKE